MLRLGLFFKLMIASLSVSLLSFALLPQMSLIMTLKALAFGTVLSIGVTVFYPEVRGIKEGDRVAVVTDSAIPGIIGRVGRAATDGRKREKIRILLSNGSEVQGIIEDYSGLITPAKIRILYEEKLVE
jgi:hypothetical protein